MATTLPQLLARVRAMVFSRRLDQEFDEKLSAHLDMAHDYVSMGSEPERLSGAAVSTDVFELVGARSRRHFRRLGTSHHGPQGTAEAPGDASAACLRPFG